ncbi:MAG: hypothetical protein ACI814_004209 [Mariniblastus sp.]|jgi:hypothetical protein
MNQLLPSSHRISRIGLCLIFSIGACAGWASDSWGQQIVVGQPMLGAVS